PPPPPPLLPHYSARRGNDDERPGGDRQRRRGRARPRGRRASVHARPRVGAARRMKPPPFEYTRPATVDEALEALARDDAKVLAGGQSLVPALNMRLLPPGVVRDVESIVDVSPV